MAGPIDRRGHRAGQNEGAYREGCEHVTASWGIGPIGKRSCFGFWARTGPRDIEAEASRESEVGRGIETGSRVRSQRYARSERRRNKLVGRRDRK